MAFINELDQAVGFLAGVSPSELFDKYNEVSNGINESGLAYFVETKKGNMLAASLLLTSAYSALVLKETYSIINLQGGDLEGVVFGSLKKASSASLIYFAFNAGAYGLFKDEDEITALDALTHVGFYTCKMGATTILMRGAINLIWP